MTWYPGPPGPGGVKATAPLKEVPVVLMLCLLGWDDLNLLALSMAKIHRAQTAT